MSEAGNQTPLGGAGDALSPRMAPAPPANAPEVPSPVQHLRSRQLGAQAEAHSAAEHAAPFTPASPSHAHHQAESEDAGAFAEAPSSYPAAAASADAPRTHLDCIEFGISDAQRDVDEEMKVATNNKPDETGSTTEDRKSVV